MFARFDVYTALNVQILVFWVVAQCEVLIRYQRFGRPCSLHIQGEVSGVQVTLQLTVSYSVSPSWRRAPCGTNDHELNL